MRCSRSTRKSAPPTGGRGDGAAAVEAAAEHAAARRGLKTSAGFRWNAGGERRRASIEIAVYPAAGGRPTAGEPVVTLRGPAPAEVAKFARACEEGAVDGPAPPFAFRLNLRAGRIAPARSAVR